MITIICALKLLNCHLVFRNCIIDIYRFLQSVEGSLIVLYSFKLEIDMCDQKPMHHVAKSQRAIVMNFANSFWHQIKFQFNFLVHITFRNNFLQILGNKCIIFYKEYRKHPNNIFTLYFPSISHYDLIDFHLSQFVLFSFV